MYTYRSNSTYEYGRFYNYTVDRISLLFITPGLLDIVHAIITKYRIGYPYTCIINISININTNININMIFKFKEFNYDDRIVILFINLFLIM